MLKHIMNYIEKLSRKSQSEIMGLAMVMILLAVGLLLFVSFGLKGSESSLSNEFTNKQLPVLLNKAIFETDATEEDCYGESIQKLLIKAGEGNSLICNNGQSAKEFSEDFISDALNKTLNTWNIEYRYSVYRGQDFTVCGPGTNFDPRNCIINQTNSEDYCFLKDISTENFFFRMNTGQLLNIKLDICS